MQDLLEGFVEGGALACVEDGVVGEVGGGVGLIDGYEPDEMVFRHGLKSVVEATLLAEGGDSVRGDVFAAERACSVCGIDEGFVGKGQELVVEGVVEVAAEIVSGPAERGAEVGAAYVADEEGVSGENGVGFVGVLLEIEYEE